MTEKTEVKSLEPNLTEVIISSYEGEYDEENGEYCGEGIAKLDNECQYEGNFQKGFFQGKGKFTWPDGVIFEGDFDHNTLIGKGTYTYPDGSVYFGDIYNGKRHGQGKLTTSMGQIYEGEWQDGVRHGQGKMIYNQEQSLIYQGSWVKNQRQGYGIMEYPSMNRYEGEWYENQKSGYGTMIWRELDEVYTGHWLADLPHGFGEHIWGESTIQTVKRQHCNFYRGNFYQGKRHGHGCFYYANGSQYSGEWIQNKKDGLGIFLYPDNRISLGIYQENKLMKGIDTENLLQAKDSGDISPQFFLNIMDILTTYPTIPSLTTTSVSSLLSLPLPPQNTTTTTTPSPPLAVVTDISGGGDGDNQDKTKPESAPNGNSNNSDNDNSAANNTIPSHLLRNNEEEITILTQRRQYIKELERLLLKYNSYLKNIYKHYVDYANRQRQRTVLLLPSSTFYTTNEKYKIAIAAIKNRKIQRRFFCLSLEGLLCFLRDLGLIDGKLFSVDDVYTIIKKMRKNRMNIIHQLYIQLNAFQKQNNEKIINSGHTEEKEGNNTTGTTATNSTDTTAMNQQEEEVKTAPSFVVGDLLDAYLDPMGHDPYYQYQGCQPILEHEFMEILVRVVAESSCRHGQINVDLFQVLSKLLHQKVITILSHGNQTIRSSHYQNFYEDEIQDLLKNRMIIHVSSNPTAAAAALVRSPLASGRKSPLNGTTRSFSNNSNSPLRRSMGHLPGGKKDHDSSMIDLYHIVEEFREYSQMKLNKIEEIWSYLRDEISLKRDKKGSNLPQGGAVRGEVIHQFLLSQSNILLDSSSQSNTIRLNEIIFGKELMKGKRHSENNPWSRFFSYEDFIDLLCRVVANEIWIYGGPSSSSTTTNNNNNNNNENNIDESMKELKTSEVLETSGSELEHVETSNSSVAISALEERLARFLKNYELVKK
eukprot:gene6857-7578_t